MKKLSFLLSLFTLACSISAMEIKHTSLDEKLLKAVKEKASVQQVLTLIEQGADVNARDDHEATPLFWAVYQNQLDLCNLLIKHGANVNPQKTTLGLVPLHFAAHCGHSDLCKVLIESGAKINIPDSYDYTPLHHAAYRGLFDVCKLLIKKGAKINAQDKDGISPLYGAITRPCSKIALLFIQNGADVQVKNARGDTPLHGATLFGHLDVCRLLIKNGADVNAQNNDGKTPLMLAASRGHVPLCELLIKNGAKTLAQDKNGQTLFMPEQNVDKNISETIIKLVMKLKTEERLSVKGDLNQQLHNAIQQEQSTEHIHELIKKGANVNAPDKDGQTPLMNAISRGLTAIPKLLIKEGLNKKMDSLHLCGQLT